MIKWKTLDSKYVVTFAAFLGGFKIGTVHYDGIHGRGYIVAVDLPGVRGSRSKTITREKVGDAKKTFEGIVQHWLKKTNLQERKEK